MLQLLKGISYSYSLSFVAQQTRQITVTSYLKFREKFRQLGNYKQTNLSIISVFIVSVFYLTVFFFQQFI